MTTIEKLTLTFRLNGMSRSCEVAADVRLADILRDHFELTASKSACDIGRCGACMVLLNGLPTNACLLRAWQIDGADIVTPEGIDQYEEGRVVKQALAQENAFQCGYCAPGFTIALTALLRTRAAIGEAEIRAALEGNICRCTGYHSIIRGALTAVQMLAVAAKP